MRGEEEEASTGVGWLEAGDRVRGRKRRRRRRTEEAEQGTGREEEERSEGVVGLTRAF